MSAYMCQLHARAALCALECSACAHMYDVEYHAHDVLCIMVITVAILAQGTSWAVAVTQASFHRRAIRDGMCVRW